MKLKVIKQTRLADTHTPVELYLKVRDRFPKSILLESNLNTRREESRSYIAFQPIASFSTDKEQITITINEETRTEEIENLYPEFDSFLKNFKVDEEVGAVFGFTSYEAVQLFETIQFQGEKSDIPLLEYKFYKYLIEFNHFTNELSFYEFLQENEDSDLNELLNDILFSTYSLFSFCRTSEESCNNTPEQFLEMVQTGKEHCQLGDVFQIVLSRRFSIEFKGDDFQVYRALRSVNPSPYLFYLDNGDYRIFGSSPETQIQVSDQKATINPIAGTYKRSHVKETDEKLAKQLLSDEKENSEHYMLVDLARNDLSRISKKVEVKSLREIHYYSHVIHMVSEVEGELDSVSPLQVLGETFPAGTLSGAPKFKAMEIIKRLEILDRNYYGGAIGYFTLNGDSNHAIMIRSFLSQNNQIDFQAGAGVVIDSVPENELKEVDNKLGALRKALQLAEEL